MIKKKSNLTLSPEQLSSRGGALYRGPRVTAPCAQGPHEYGVEGGRQGGSAADRGAKEA
jgi:hypothetical protein